MRYEEADLLGTRLAAVVHPPDDRDWGDVRRRASTVDRRRRHRILMLVVIMGCALVPASWGVSEFMTSLAGSPPAESMVIRQFRSLERLPFNRLSGHVIPAQTRLVHEQRLSTGVYRLYIAPTEQGGFCEGWFRGATGTTSCFHRSRDRSAQDPLRFSTRSDSHGTVIVTGEVFVENSTIEVTVGSERFPVRTIWVTRPVSAGFFIVEVPGSSPHPTIALRLPGRKEVSVFARATFDERGTRVLPLPNGRAIAVPSSVVYAKRKLFRAVGPGGATMAYWVAPRRDGGRCYWTVSILICSSPGSGTRPLSVGLYDSGSAYLFGSVKPDVRTVVLRFEDGARVVVRPRAGAVVYMMSGVHCGTGHRLVEATARTASGDVSDREAFDPRLVGPYPCASVKRR